MIIRYYTSFAERLTRKKMRIEIVLCKVLKTYDRNGVSGFSWLSKRKNPTLISYCISTPNKRLGPGQQKVVSRLKVIDEAKVNEERHEQK